MRLILAIALVAIGLLSSVHVAVAQVVEITTAALGVASSALLGKSIKEIIEKARLAASTLIADGERSGNNLLIRAGDEMNVAIDNAIRQIGAQIDDKFDDLDEKQRRLLAGLSVATETAKDLANKGYLAKDTLALDVRSILGSLPLVDEVFVIQRISGLTQIDKSSDYRLQLIGSYAGTPASNYQTTIFLSLNGKKLETFRVDPSEIHVTDIIIPAGVLKDYFKPEEVAIVELELGVEYRHPTTFMWVFEDTKTDTISTKLHLILYPRLAGEFIFTSKAIVYGWEDITPQSTQYTGPNAHCDSDCEGHYGSIAEFDIVVPGGHEPPIIGDQRIVAANCYPVPGHNAFDVDISWAILDPTRARCHFRARSHPSTYRMEVSVQQWDKIAETDVVKIVKLNYDEILEFRVPPNITAIRISGKTLTGDVVDYLIDEVNPRNPVEMIKKADNIDGVSYFVRPIRPTGLD